MITRWEHGSEFQFPAHWGAKTNAPALPGKLSLASGRDALALLVIFGAHTKGWQRLFVPTYYCEDVLPRISNLGVEVVRYSSGPHGIDEVPVGEGGDVLLRTAYFGWGLPALTESFAGEVIEDHTHDPWGTENSSADYCFASLRKTLPIPDGGILWSPSERSLPEQPQVTVEHVNTTMKKLAAMALKRVYLNSGSVEKLVFRTLFLEAEEELGTGDISGMSPWSVDAISSFPVNKWREIRGRNVGVFKAAFGENERIRMLGPSNAVAPFAVILQVDSKELRDALRGRLCEENIYPAVLWPPSARGLDKRSTFDRHFAETTLVLHADARYTVADMKRVAERVHYHVRQLLA